MTNQIINTTNTITMSSKEIATLTNKEHKNVLTDIRTMFEQLEMDSADFSAQYKDSTGRSLPCFNLDKELTTCLVSGYNVKLRMAIIKRWIELENQVTAPKLPTNFKEALHLLIEAEEEKEALALTIQEQQVDVDTLDRISKRKGSMSMRDAARHLDVRPIDLREWMLDNGWTFKVGNAYRPRASHTTHITLSANEYKSLVRVTWKGLVLLSKRMNKELQDI